MAIEMLQYLDPDGLDETVLNIGQIKTSLEGQISDLGESIEEEMQDLPYARPDGLYPDMTVGAVIGADSTAQWAQRESTGSGSAIVRSVQGAAVGWNQLCDNDKPTNTSYGLTGTNNGDGSWTLNGTPTALAGIEILSSRLFLANHKYLVKGCPAGGSNETYFFYFLQSGVDFGSGGFKTPTTDTTGNLRFIAKVGTTFDNLVIWPQVFDLTQMFGAGNEPTTVAEFEAMYPESYYPYSAPTLKPVRIAGIESTDANGDELDSVEWDTYTLRAAGSVRDELTADELVTRVGVVDLGTLNWTYQSVGDFMYAYINSLGAAAGYNCITPATNTMTVVTSDNKYLRIYGTGYTDAAAFKAAMSGVLLFYELATPTTTPISPALPMTYRVQQGGTERIVVPEGEVSAAPILTIAEPVNAGDEFARIWEAIQSLEATRNVAQLSRTDAVSIEETKKDTVDATEIETIKEAQ